MNTTIRIPDGYVDTETLAAMKGVTPGAVRNSITLGRIQAIKFGELWAIPKSEIERYMKAKSGRPKKKFERSNNNGYSK